MRQTALVLGCVCLAGLLTAGCKIPTLKSTDIMYGPQGEIVKMKSPDDTMKIKYKDDGSVKIKGARGIGGGSRVAPLPIESGRDVGVHGVVVQPGGPRPFPASPGGGSVQQQTTTEETTVVH